MAARALLFAAAALGIGAVVVTLASNLGYLYGAMLSVGAIAALCLSAAARHRHDAVRWIAMVASVVLAGYGGLGFLSLFGSPSHMFDPGPSFRIALGVAAGGFAVAAVALVYHLFVETGRR